MKCNDLNRAVARATGDTAQTIKHRGFGPDLNEQAGPYLDWDIADLERKTPLFP
ncbi:hypothetical protein [Stratiformator vulcanicus]|uniref:Uncharacterized protein n=1 Tax=Stratiformator vulcanicus TaxID=2527980 RepID=A0A517R124_9PLAN|nr:hypothetical protein [Stratiformator vulcanicus]QDT37578.1 hypothetical protein Pan189_19580 [Stratiformator vulcanicus]